jgi:hypothetical protein
MHKEYSFDGDLGKIEENSCKIEVEYWMSWVGVYFESGFEMSRVEHSVSSPLPEFSRLGSRLNCSASWFISEMAIQTENDIFNHHIQSGDASYQFTTPSCFPADGKRESLNPRMTAEAVKNFE